jgi:hypothetical protein
MTGYTAKDMVAVRKGHIYCAPFCGGNCTHAAFERATAAAGEVVKQLGSDWEPRVWENLGWHWSAVSRDGLIKIHGYPDGTFAAFLGENPAGGRWVGHGHTPIAAVADVLLPARKELRIIEQLVRSATKVAKGAATP